MNKKVWVLARIVGCQMGCLLFGLLAMMFFFAPIDPGDIGFSAGWTLAAVCCWLVRTFYHWSGMGR